MSEEQIESDYIARIAKIKRDSRKRQPSRKSNKVIPLTKTGREPSMPVEKR